mgnify:CR=1 FL=1
MLEKAKSGGGNGVAEAPEAVPRPGTRLDYTENGINLDSSGTTYPACYDFYYEVEVTRRSRAMI